jgi:hypothetical protein
MIGLHNNEIEPLCKKLLLDKSIKNRIVILCEGEVFDKYDEVRSPNFFRKSEYLQDSVFYKNCIPKGNILPVFSNFGSRSQVVNAFYKLKELHFENPSESYLTPDKLFAILDADIQNFYFTENEYNYFAKDIFEIYNLQYNGFHLNDLDLSEHKFFITGLIHKEAYFLLPENQKLFDDYKISPLYNGKKVILDQVYNEIIKDEKIKNKTDEDLNKYFDKVNHRISHTNLDISNIDNFKKSWISNFQKSVSDEEKEHLIKSLLILKKAKPYWESLTPNSQLITHERFLENLSLEIAKTISDKKALPQNHISYFFKLLNDTF